MGTTLDRVEIGGITAIKVDDLYLGAYFKHRGMKLMGAIATDGKGHIAWLFEDDPNRTVIESDYFTDKDGFRAFIASRDALLAHADVARGTSKKDRKNNGQHHKRAERSGNGHPSDSANPGNRRTGTDG